MFSSQASTPGPERSAYPRHLRLTRTADIARVRAEGKRVRTRLLDVRTLASLHAFARVGIVVPKYGQSAVARNRLKRQLREITRVDLLQHVQPMDIVIWTFPAAYQADFDTLRSDMVAVAQRVRAGTADPEPR